MVGGIEKWTDGEISSVYGSTSWKNRIGRTAGGKLIVSEVKARNDQVTQQEDWKRGQRKMERTVSGTIPHSRRLKSGQRNTGKSSSVFGTVLRKKRTLGCLDGVPAAKLWYMTVSGTIPRMRILCCAPATWPDVVEPVLQPSSPSWAQSTVRWPSSFCTAAVTASWSRTSTRRRRQHRVRVGRRWAP